MCIRDRGGPRFPSPPPPAPKRAGWVVSSPPLWGGIGCGFFPKIGAPPSAVGFPPPPGISKDNWETGAAWSTVAQAFALVSAGQEGRAIKKLERLEEILGRSWDFIPCEQCKLISKINMTMTRMQPNIHHINHTTVVLQRFLHIIISHG